jgi:hypothetical protein
MRIMNIHELHAQTKAETRAALRLAVFGVFYGAGFLITMFYAVRIGMKLGLTGGDVYPAIGGFFLLAWSPFILLVFAIRDLRARIATLEGDLGSKGSSQLGIQTKK